MKRVLTFVLAMIQTSAAMAQGLDDIVQVEVLPGWTMESGNQMAALSVTLAPGWKTYWRAPGDAGIPPMLSYAGSENVGSVRMQWPVPDVFHQNGMRSIGYEDRVILPVELTRNAAGEMRLAGQMSIGICQDICVPAHLNFDGVLAPDGRRDPLIVAALVDRPLRAEEAGVVSAVCEIAPSEYGVALRAEVVMPALAGTEELVIEAGNPEIWVSEPEVARRGDVLTAFVGMAHVSGAGFAVDRSAVRITVFGRDVAVDIRGCRAP